LREFRLPGSNGVPPGRALPDLVGHAAPLIVAAAPG
jgi:hypothetical protein